MADIQPIPMTGKITTAAEARYLVRMSGLPLLLSGCAGICSLLIVDNALTAGIVFAVSVTSIGLALVLRSGAHWPVPIVFALSVAWLGWLAVKLAYPVAFFILVFPVSLVYILPLLISCPVLALFAMSGLRGWIWLIRQSRATPA